MIWALISLALTLGGFILSVIFKTAGKLRLTIPLLYVIVAAVSTIFSDWVTQHEKLVLIGLYIITALSLLSWVISVINTINEKKSQKALEEDAAWQIKRAKELGIPLKNISFNENNDLIDSQTGEPIDLKLR